MFGLNTFRTLQRLKELEETMLRLTRLVESHDLEWDDMRARCKRLLDRTEKAARRLEPGVESEDLQTAGEAGDGQPVMATGFSLSPSQARLQQQIIRQRAAKRTQ